MNLQAPTYFSISSSNIEKLKKHTTSFHPREACALLFGEIKDERILVKEVITTPNQMRSLHKFGISSKDKQKAIALATSPLVGIYHSHPHESDPSSDDP